MPKKINFILYFLLLLYTLSCKKSKKIDEFAPVIKIESPKQNNIYAVLTGDCHLEFTATDDVELFGIEVSVSNSSETKYYSNNLSIHNDHHHYHDHL